jgi:urease accessory protein
VNTRHSFASGLVVVTLLVARDAAAHGFGGGGALHPLTGLDHMLAMVAIGAWSAQRGGRAIVLVPAIFLASMAIGGATGLAHVGSVGGDRVVALSVVALGLAIGFRVHGAMAAAVGATVIFGFVHGYAHGIELPAAEAPWRYVAGFLFTTAALHVVGAVSALLVLERPRGGLFLRRLGVTVATAGICLVLRG